MVLSLIVVINMAACGDGPCVDGVQGDRVTDGTSTAINLINDSNDFVHLIGSRESTDLCNRVDDRGGSRFIFVRAEFESCRYVPSPVVCSSTRKSARCPSK